MLGIKIFNVILWFIAGIVVLKSKKITKFDYGCAWIALEMILISFLFE